MTTKANDAAFPTDEYMGLTKREYFAGLAMQAIVSASGDSHGNIDYVEDIVAANAVIMADELIKKLNLGA